VYHWADVRGDTRRIVDCKDGFRAASEAVATDLTKIDNVCYWR
jgi:hypothetical protein